MTYINELRRKLFHMSSSAFPCAYLVISRELMLSLIFPMVLLTLALDLARQHHPWFRTWFARWFGNIVREKESRRLSGASYVLISVFVCIAIFPKPVAIAALLMMSISDALASLLGRSLPRVPFLGKSLAGTLTFFVSALLMTWFLFPERPIAALVGAVVGTAAELVTIRIGRFEVDDNLRVPLAAGLAIMLLL